MMSCACLEGRGNSSSHIYDRSRFIIITWLGCTWSTARVDTAVDDNIYIVRLILMQYMAAAGCVRNIFRRACCFW